MKREARDFSQQDPVKDHKVMFVLLLIFYGESYEVLEINEALDNFALDVINK